MSERWTEWERPWTRATGVLDGYEAVDGEPLMGATVAVRQASRPYLPTFAPWWPGVHFLGVEDGKAIIEAEDGRMVDLDLTEHPFATHWAALRHE